MRRASGLPDSLPAKPPALADGAFTGLRSREQGGNGNSGQLAETHTWRALACMIGFEPSRDERGSPVPDATALTARFAGSPLAAISLSSVLAGRGPPAHRGRTAT